MHVTCQNSNGIAIPFAFEFPMSSRKAVNQCEGAGLYYGACLYREVTSLTDESENTKDNARFAIPHVENAIENTICNSF